MTKATIAVSFGTLQPLPARLLTRRAAVRLSAAMFPTKQADRLFFALLPPPTQTADLAVARDRLCRGGSPVADAMLHVTLLLLADTAPDRPDLFDPLLAVAALVGDAVASGHAPFGVEFAIPSGRGTVVLTPPALNLALDALGEDLARSARAAGLARHPDFRFSPHVTLARRATLAPDPRLAPVSWTADRLTLVHSHVGLGRHDRVVEWSLGTNRMGEP